MTLQLREIYNDSIEVRYGEQSLFHYIYAPDTPQFESPKPYFHPIHTLAGNLVTVFRPHDHVWHKGLCMTATVLNDQNFWGGPTYVRDQGYKRLENNGGMFHQGWQEIRTSPDTIQLVESLDWITQAGARWIDEVRSISVGHVDEASGSWTLDFGCRLTNVHDEDLNFGSPTTEGRPMAGYGGLFWRGPRSFRDGDARAAGGLSGEEIMGAPGEWLAYSGLHDGSGDRSTLLFLDHPENVRYPNKWFMRTEPYACASFAFSFDEEYALPPGESIDQRYRIVIADGSLSEEQIGQYVAQWTP